MSTTVVRSKLAIKYGLHMITTVEIHIVDPLKSSQFMHAVETCHLTWLPRAEICPNHWNSRTAIIYEGWILEKEEGEDWSSFPFLDSLQQKPLGHFWNFWREKGKAARPWFLMAWCPILKENWKFKPCFEMCFFYCPVLESSRNLGPILKFSLYFFAR